ncbi:MAG: dihydrodipicolinate reductase C-terminal domain-containing protein [Candidatus Limnocylindrales bacterium]|jgi:4-hydroxy-tetrahydrodipicolinate reductase
MLSIVAGDGSMGRAVTAALAGRGIPPAAILGMPDSPAGHAPASFHGVEVVFDFTVGDAVRRNVGAALEGGVRSFVIGTTNWAGDRAAVEALLNEHGAAAVASANFSLGVMLFARLVEDAARLFGPFAEYDPYLVEWHRRTKTDRPSGTAIELSRRIIAAHPRKTRVAQPMAQGAPMPEELDVSVIRAGSAPGMHLVGFDAPGESLEMRLTARDRSAYAAGAVTAAEWLLAEPRAPGFHSFDDVVDSIIAKQEIESGANGRPSAASLGSIASTARNRR